MATDNAGNVEAAAAVAQATTTVPPQSTLTGIVGVGAYGGSATLVYGSSSLAGKLVTFSPSREAKYNQRRLSNHER